MKALVLNTSLKRAIVEDVDRPNPGSHEILVNVRAIALNPKRIIGTDFAGVIVEAGSAIGDLSDPRVKAGTRVAGFLQGGPRESELRRSFNDQHVWLDCCSSSIWSAWLTISIFLDATSDSDCMPHSLLVSLLGYLECLFD
ncbi:hypothetical protein LB503_012587 [Fusarium chuoi]|nr:hypothetical protein LB503_012587 [Fusarium chuoi]